MEEVIEGVMKGLFTAQKTDIESLDPVGKERKHKKVPLVSCEKYDKEERKALFGEEKNSESFSGSKGE